jgi:hypothetical protein
VDQVFEHRRKLGSADFRIEILGHGLEVDVCGVDDSGKRVQALGTLKAV